MPSRQEKVATHRDESLRDLTTLRVRRPKDSEGFSSQRENQLKIRRARPTVPDDAKDEDVIMVSSPAVQTCAHLQKNMRPFTDKDAPIYRQGCKRLQRNLTDDPLQALATALDFLEKSTEDLFWLMDPLETGAVDAASMVDGFDDLGYNISEKR